MSNFHPDTPPKVVVRDVPTAFCGHCGYRLEQTDYWRRSFYCQCSSWFIDDGKNGFYHVVDGKTVKDIPPKNFLKAKWSSWRQLAPNHPSKDEGFGITSDLVAEGL